MPSARAVWFSRIAVVFPLLVLLAPNISFLSHQALSFLAVSGSLLVLGVVTRSWRFAERDAWILGFAGFLSVMLAVRGFFLGNSAFAILGLAHAPWYSALGLFLGVAWLVFVARVVAAGFLDRRTISLILAVLFGVQLFWLFLGAFWPALFSGTAIGHPLHSFLFLAALLVSAPWWMPRVWQPVWLLALVPVWIFGDVSLAFLFGAVALSLSIVRRTDRQPLWWVMASGGLFLSALFASPLSSVVTWPRYVALARPAWSSMLQVFRSLSLGDWLFGSGVSSFADTFVRSFPPEIAASPYWSLSFSSGTSVFSTLSVQWGVLGLLLVAVLLTVWGWGVRGGARPVFFLLLLVGMLWSLSGPALLLCGVLVVLLDEYPKLTIHEKDVSRAFFLSSIVGVAGILLSVTSLLVGYWLWESRMVLSSDPERSLRYLDRANVLGGRDAALSLEMSQRLLDVVRLSMNDANADTKRLGALAEASVHYAVRATALDSRSALLWVGRSSVYLQLLQVADGADTFAVTSAARATELAPGHPAVWNALGRARAATVVRLGQTMGDSPSPELVAQRTQALADAKVAYERSLALRPQYVTARLGLSSLEVADGDIAAAVRVLEEGMALVPRDVSLMTQLGALYSQQGKLDQARALLDEVTVLSPSAANARWYLSYVLEAQGDRQAALAQIQILQTRFPDNSTLTARFEQLSQEPHVSLPEAPASDALAPAPLIDEPVTN